MYFDLNIPFNTDLRELQQTLLFLHELGYNSVAINHSITGRVPQEISNPIPQPLPFSISPALQVLRRCTLHLSDPNQNHRLAQLSSSFDIFALRPSNEKAFQQACHSLDCDIISLDFSIRHPFFFQLKTVKSALDRGVRFEICYAPAILNVDNGLSRRNLISNATQLIRATRGKGIIISSEARKAIACRSPADIINLASLWGLHQERGTEAVGKEARSVVAQARMKRTSFRGVIDVIHGGSPPAALSQAKSHQQAQEIPQKRKADAIEVVSTEIESSESKPISKREQKRRAKKAKLDAMEQHFAKPAGKSSSVTADAA